MNQSVLIIAAHPDDEVLGCGGTIAKLAKQGASVRVAFLADGVSSRARNETAQNEKLSERRLAARKANELLGAKSVSFGDFPDNRMDTLALLDVVKVVEQLVVDHQPEIIFTHHAGDLNVDHRCVHQAVVTACRPQCGHPVKSILCFETPSSTEWQIPSAESIFMPNWFVDITSTWERKLAALDAYAAELRPWPHPRSKQGIEHLARWRGATIGAQAAEAFVLGRHLA